MHSACLVFATLLSDDTPPPVALRDQEEDGIGGPSPTWVGLVVCSRSEVRASVATAALQTGAPTNTTFYSRTPQNPDCHKSRDSSKRRATGHCPSKTWTQPQTGEKDLESMWIVTRAALSTRRPLDRPAVWVSGGIQKDPSNQVSSEALSLDFSSIVFELSRFVIVKNFRDTFSLKVKRDQIQHTCLSRSCLAECEHANITYCDLSELWRFQGLSQFILELELPGGWYWLILVDGGGGPAVGVTHVCEGHLLPIQSHTLPISTLTISTKLHSQSQYQPSQSQLNCTHNPNINPHDLN